MTTTPDTAAREMLRKVTSRAVPAGTDSTGAPMVKMRAALIDEARELVAPASSGGEPAPGGPLAALCREVKAYNDGLNDDAQDGGAKAPTGDDYNAIIAMVAGAARTAEAPEAPGLALLIAEALGYQGGAFDEGEPINGADLVDFFADWRRRALAVLSGERLSFGDVTKRYAEKQADAHPEYAPYIAGARLLEREGELEIDDSALVSMSDEPDAGGAYVSAWVWVSNAQAAKAEAEAQA